MQFTSDVKWQPFDFIVAGTLLFTTGVAFEFIMFKLKNVRYKLAALLLLLILLLLIWLELAVGIFGIPFGGN